ncbi:MAG: hypothetical protein NTW86_01830 [Candidatus Sumerlaeota bacterium]|nr:hypothetical protein [Candidatus Sumerlaeota bacterium]
MSAPKSAAHSRPGTFWSLFDRPGGWVFVAGALAAAAGAFYLQWLHVERYKETPWIDSFVLPQPKFVRRLAVGYDAMVADFLYLRAIQAFGGIYYRPTEEGQKYDPVFNYFDVILALDPHFIEAISFGSLVIGDEGKAWDLALKLLDTGQWNNWRRYVPWYEAAFLKIWDLKQPDRDARFFVRQATKAHDAPEWISHWESEIDQQAGQFTLALQRWIQTYAEGVAENKDYLAGMALNKIHPIVGEWHKKILQDALDKYRQEKGAWPQTLQQLADEGYLPPVDVVDPDALVELMETARAEGVDLRPLVGQLAAACMVKKSGVLPPYNPAVPDDRFALICMSDYDHPAVGLESARKSAAAAALEAYRAQINDYYQKNGRYPDSVEGWPAEAYGRPLCDPYCRGWEYNPQTGILRSKGDPDL